MKLWVGSYIGKLIVHMSSRADECKPIKPFKIKQLNVWDFQGDREYPCHPYHTC